MTKPLLPPVFVNGVEIPAAAIAAEAQNHPAPEGKPGLAWHAAARALALREACLQAARIERRVPEPAEIAPGQWETEDEALIRAWLEDSVRPEEPDQTGLQTAYAARPDRFRAPDLWDVAHILIPGKDAAARDLARGLAAELGQTPARFAELARQHSACSSAGAGGHLGQIGPGDTVAEFEAALCGLQPGQITHEPVETRFGLHLIRLDAHARGAVLPYEAVRPQLLTAARKAAWARAARALAETLLTEARITGLAPGKAAS